MDAMQSAISELRSLFNTKMEAFQEDLKSATSTTPTVEVLAADFNNFKKLMMASLENLQQQMEVVLQACDNLEMHSRRKILLLHGLPEQTSDGLLDTVRKVLNHHIELPELDTAVIEQCLRLGPVKQGRTRPVLIRFDSKAQRDKIWFSKTKLKETGLTLSEFLTRRRHEVFLAARKSFGVSKCWSKDGVILVLDADGVKRRVFSLSDVERITGKQVFETSNKNTANQSEAPKASGVKTRKATSKKK